MIVETSVPGASARPPLDDPLRSLIWIKLVFILPIMLVSVGSFLGLTTLAGFSKGLLGTKIVGSLNVGFTLIVADYLLILGLAVLYTRIAVTIFDPIAKQIER